MIVVNSLIAFLYIFMGGLVSANLPNEIPFIMLVLLGIIGVVNVVCAVLLLQWKKLGFWGFIVTTIAATVINISAGLDATQIASGVVGIAILFAILQIKEGGRSTWENLE